MPATATASPKKGTAKHNIAKELRSFAVPVKKLKFDPNNANVHEPESIEAIRRSLERFGQDQPIVVQRKGMVVRKGNGRLTAALALGWTHIACLIVDDDDVEAAARAIADNRSADFRKWNYAVLGKLFKKIEKVKPDLAFATSFTTKQIKEEGGLFTRREHLVNGRNSAEPPADFKEVDENIEVDHVCPNCGFKFSGGETAPKGNKK